MGANHFKSPLFTPFPVIPPYVVRTPHPGIRPTKHTYTTSYKMNRQLHPQASWIHACLPYAKEAAMSTRLVMRILGREPHFRVPAISDLESRSWTSESSKITLRKFHMGPSNNHLVKFALMGPSWRGPPEAAKNQQETLKTELSKCVVFPWEIITVL